ncbi:M23 family metallopeptidase [Desulfogranum japonicum]|uniref:M23 family metallopeptidase n=1 Tax=Desulfogranum japonicum TaxID=231447 RepID=UPI00042566B3|nr:M23 family metallopeptidase [Desulfogranum japonicum]
MAKRNKRRSLSGHRRGGFLKKFSLTLIIVAVIAAAVSGLILFETEDPGLTLEKEITYLGSNVELPFKVYDKRSGVKSIVVSLEQQGVKSEIFNRSFERQAWFKPAGPATVAETVNIDTKNAQLQDGKADLVVTVRDFSLNGLLKGNETVKRIPVIIDSVPPRVSITHAQNYIRPGGSGIVIYEVSENSPRHGVQIDDLFFQGFPLDQHPKQFISYIALPWNSEEPQNASVIARDEAGNEGKALIHMNFKAVAKKSDRINVSDNFLKNKLPEFQERYPGMQGTPIEQYLHANRDIRQQNAATISKICSNPDPKQLWNDRFLRMAGANRAGFADQRTYFYNGSPVDNQTHLGIDIASTARAEVRAANSGKVAYADYLGIYGYMIILDHGQGLYSLYSHLSKIDTTVGSMVEKDALIGHTGATGMAGGDHLHFSMLIHGIFVTPKEWWDQHWIDVNIKEFLKPGA